MACFSILSTLYYIEQHRLSVVIKHKNIVHNWITIEIGTKCRKKQKKSTRKIRKKEKNRRRMESSVC